MKPVITAMGTAVPRYKISQDEILNFMIKAHDLHGEEARRLKLLYRASGIQSRYSVLSDYQKTENFTFYPNNDTLEPFPVTSKRQEKYRHEAVLLSVQSAEKCLAHAHTPREEITHIITVSCTGLYAPGLDIELVYKLGLNPSVKRTAINFMGCYAAFNALKVASAFCESDPEARVLIVCTELCSIHFQKESSEDNLLANALFGDGSAAVLVEGRPNGTNALELSEFKCTLAPTGMNEMAWEVGDTGFEMKLSAYVPNIIQSGIKNLLGTLNNGKPMEFDFYAIHPGGKKILQVVEEQLAMSRENNRHSRSVLKNYGNMSSATILFVFHEIYKHLNASDDQKKVLSFAFGPGLTMESLILTTHIAS
jgi:predicted naringenin-chalcone synthase